MTNVGTVRTVRFSTCLIPMFRARYFNTGGLHSQEMRNEIKKSIAEIYKLKYEVIKLAGDFTTVNANNRNNTGEN